MSARATFGAGVFVAVAAGIAGAAFALGQVAPGLGIPFAAAASLGWTAWNAGRARQWQNKNG